MRNCQTQERDRAAECCRSGSKKSRTEQEPVAGPMNIDTQVGCITFTQQDSIQGLHQQHSSYQAHQYQNTIERQAIHTDSTEVAHAPDNVVMNTFFRSTVVEQ